MKKSTRIYIYKVTFEEIPHWYWGVHKEKKFGELYLGTPVTHKWMWDFYTPKIQILEFFPYTEEGWKEANLVENRLIKPDINNPLCLNEAYGGYISLTCRSEGGKKGSSVTNAEKDDLGRSAHAVRTLGAFNESLTPEQKSERSRKAGEAAAASMTPEQKTERGRKGAKALYASLTPEQRSEKARKAREAMTPEQIAERNRKAARAAFESMTPEQRSDRGRKGGITTSSQVWESLEDGFRGSAGNVAQHNRRNGWDPEARVRVYPPASPV
jgi:general stress protein YciG